MEKLWIHPHWYVEVDTEGFYRGALGEGAFGSVLCLKGSATTLGSPKSAWKLPRLLADSLEENAYVEGLLEQESRIVQWVRAADTNGIVANCLMRCMDLTPGGFFRGRRQLGDAVGEAATQNQQILLVQFQKSRPPRLCLVDFNDVGLTVHPEALRAEIEPLISRKVWETLIGVAGPQVAKPSFIAIPQYKPVEIGSNSTIVDTLEKAITDKRPLQSWYAGLSSIMWEWAALNLQEAISRNRLSHWNFGKHLSLWKRITQGVHFLHSKNLLHADLRPANIFCIGDGTDPSSYRVGDYGSLSSGDGLVGDLHGGDTVIGPDVGRGRTSPFYSLERRSGIERESADIAIVVCNAEEKAFRIWLGWKSQVLDKEGNVKSGLFDTIRAASLNALDTRPQLSLDRLRPDDRLRLRDQVFRVKQVVETGQELGEDLKGGLFCICYPTVATVVHDRLTVNELFPDTPLANVQPAAIPLSSYTELRQWSAATDVFSIGALFLYSVYSAGRQADFLPRTVKKDNEDDLARQNLSKDGAEAIVVIDAEFRQSMSVIESVPYLKVLWPDLDELWRKIVAAKDEAERLSTRKQRDAVYIQLFSSIGMLLNTVVSNVTASVPNVKVVLQYLGNNTIQFVLFLHFVLRCIHRRDHVESGNSAATVPFCVDRTEKPIDSGAASLALDALAELEILLANDNFLDQTVETSKVPDYDVRSEYLIKDQNQRLEKEKLESIAKIDQLGQQISIAEASAVAEQSRTAEAARELKNFAEQTQKMEEEKRELSRKLEEIGVQLGVANQKLDKDRENAHAQLEALRTELNKLSEKSEREKTTLVKQLDGYKEQVLVTTETIQGQAGRVAQFEQLRAENSQLIERLDKDKTALMDQVEAARTEANTTKVRFSEQLEQFRVENSRYAERLDKEKTKLASQLEGARTEVTAAQARFAEQQLGKERQVSRIETERAKLDRLLSECKTHVQQMEGVNASQQTEINRIHAAMRDIKKARALVGTGGLGYGEARKALLSVIDNLDEA